MNFDFGAILDKIDIDAIMNKLVDLITKIDLTDILNKIVEIVGSIISKG